MPYLSSLYKWLQIQITDTKVAFRMIKLAFRTGLHTNCVTKSNLIASFLPIKPIYFVWFIWKRYKLRYQQQMTDELCSHIKSPVLKFNFNPIPIQFKDWIDKAAKPTASINFNKATNKLNQINSPVRRSTEYWTVDNTVANSKQWISCCASSVK